MNYHENVNETNNKDNLGEKEIKEKEIKEKEIKEKEIKEKEMEINKEVCGSRCDNKSGGANVGIRKRIRDFIVNKHVEFIKNSGIPPDLASLIIKIIHFRLPFDLFLTAHFSSPFIALCLWIFVMCVFSCFLFLDGCVLSSIEYKLNGNSLNVMDIFLWMFKMEANFKNRYKSTIIAAIIYLTLFFLMVYNKGGFASNNLNKLMYFMTFSYFTGFISYDKHVDNVEDLVKTFYK